VYYLWKKRNSRILFQLAAAGPRSDQLHQTSFTGTEGEMAPPNAAETE
jgi:hypothetical protein